MQVVIEIYDYLYNQIFSDAEIMIYTGRGCGKTLLATLLRSIRIGTPLPKGHGDLIDRSKLKTTDVSPEPWYSPMWAYSEWMIDDAEVVVPADKEEIKPYEKCKTCGQNRESCCGCQDVLELEQKIRRTQNECDSDGN